MLGSVDKNLFMGLFRRVFTENLLYPLGENGAYSKHCFLLMGRVAHDAQTRFGRKRKAAEAGATWLENEFYSLSVSLAGTEVQGS